MKKDSTAPNWRRTTLEEIAAPIPNAIVDGPFGSNLKISDYVEDGVPVLQGKNITNDTFRWFDVRFISTHKASELKRSSVRTGDILLVKIGSIGYSAVVRDLRGFDFAIIPANLAKITPNTAIIDTEYLHKWLTSVVTKRYLEGVASKTAQPALSLGKIKALPVPLPPLPEQRRIAEVLDRAEALRDKRRAVLAQLDTLTQSIFLDLFGDPATNPKGWPLSTIGAVSEQVTDGEHLTPKRTTTGIKLLSARNIRDGYLDFQDVDYVGPEEYERIKSRCNPSLGDVLISCSGTIGRVALVETNESLSLVRSVALVRPKRSVVGSKFLEHYLRTTTLKERMLRRANASSQANLFQGQIRELPVYLPPVSLQQDLARRVESVGRLRAAHRASLTELDSLFATLQHRAFRGEL